MALIEWGVAQEILPGQQQSGDHYLVKTLRQGVLLAVVDGVGHGQDARRAAELAIRSLEEMNTGSLIPLVRRCQATLQGTRGVVLSMAFFNGQDGTMSWLGVGNVEGVLLRKQGEPRRESLLLRAGLVGAHLPPLSAATVPVSPGDLLILSTDGVRGGFTESLNLNGPAQETAQHILGHHWRNTDDALVLVARYVHQNETAARE